MAACKSCKYSVESQGQQLACRRYPPQPFPVTTQLGQPATMCIRPQVKADDHCGEYMPKPAAIKL